MMMMPDWDFLHGQTWELVGSPLQCDLSLGSVYTNHMPPVKQRFLQVVDMGCTLSLLPLQDETAGLGPWAYSLVLHKPES